MQTANHHPVPHELHAITENSEGVGIYLPPELPVCGFYRVVGAGLGSDIICRTDTAEYRRNVVAVCLVLRRFIALLLGGCVPSSAAIARFNFGSRRHIVGIDCIAAYPAERGRS